MDKQALLQGDEGLWLFNAFPNERLFELHGILLPPNSLHHAQRAAVRMNNGGSASFVSPHGLIATNHHVAASVLEELSTAEHDILKDGFYAAQLCDELPAQQLEVNVLWEIEDVTERVRGAVVSKMKPAAAFLAKREMIARIEAESKDATGLRSDVVTLYGGGQYHLYRYKKYTDVRIVFAPEKAIGAFGDDIDNYEFPRYNLDCTFLRVYENGAPLKTEHYFKWSTQNSSEGDLVFVAGHPGSTNRMNTLARILSLRDVVLPAQVYVLYRREVNLLQFAGRSIEHRRRVEEALHGVQNTRKRLVGQLRALQDPAFVIQKAEAEGLVWHIVQDDPELAHCAKAWDIIEHAEKELRIRRAKYNFLEAATAFDTLYFDIARTIVRLVDEDAVDNEKRLPEYVISARDSLLDELYSPAPIYANLEEHTLANSLAELVEEFGFAHAIVIRVLQGMSPQSRARALVAGTSLGDVEVRKRLVLGGRDAVARSSDPFIMLAREIDRDARAIRKDFEEKVIEPQRQGYALLTEALFALYGEDLYPDATFTLRLAYGQVLPKTEGDIATTIGSTYAHADRHENSGFWKLPESWEHVRNKVCGSNVQFNFLSTLDIHGGNSGSPVFNVKFELVGLLFDGTVEALGSPFMYNPETNRSVSVHAAGILYALREIYDAKRLVAELVPLDS